MRFGAGGGGINAPDALRLVRAVELEDDMVGACSGVCGGGIAAPRGNTGALVG